MRQSARSLMKKHRNFLKIFSICICGEKSGRKCWYKEGIQLCETETIEKKNENGYDHISIAVDRVEEVMERVKTYPVEIINDHWFALPNGTKIELKLLENWKLND